MRMRSMRVKYIAMPIFPVPKRINSEQGVTCHTLNILATTQIHKSKTCSQPSSYQLSKYLINRSNQSIKHTPIHGFANQKIYPFAFCQTRVETRTGPTESRSSTA